MWMFFAMKMPPRNRCIQITSILAILIVDVHLYHNLSYILLAFSSRKFIICLLLNVQLSIRSLPTILSAQMRSNTPNLRNERQKLKLLGNNLNRINYSKYTIH